MRYEGVYPGIDLVYYGAPGQQLEYDFVVRPGADAARAAVSFEGGQGLRVDAETGDLLIETPVGELRQRRPFVYQEVGGERREVESSYELRGSGRVGFRLGAYLAYSSYLGGSADDY